MSAHFQPTDAQARALFMRGHKGPLVMLNLLRLRDVADYAATPALAPEKPISGAEAFQKYIDHTLPFLTRSGGELVFLGDGGAFFIGPPDEQWDLVMMVRQASLESFMAFANDAACLEGLGHRTAAVSDTRLLPLVARP